MMLTFSVPGLAVTPSTDTTVESGTSSVKLDGMWLGSIDIHGKKLRLLFKFKADEKGNYTAVFDSIDQGVSDIPVSKMVLDNNKVEMEVAEIGAVFNGSIRKTGNAIAGEWMQGTLHLPLLLKPTDTVPEPPTRFRKAITLDPKIYDDFVGSYQHSPTRIMVISKENDKLFAKAGRNPKAELFPQSENKFFIKVLDGDITFVRDDSGKVIKLIFRQGNYQMMAEKIK